MILDWTINIGHVVAVVTLCVVVIGLFRAILLKMDRMEFRVNLMWQWFKKTMHINGGKNGES